MALSNQSEDAPISEVFDDDEALDIKMKEKRNDTESDNDDQDESKKPIMNIDRNRKFATYKHPQVVPQTTLLYLKDDDITM